MPSARLKIVSGARAITRARIQLERSASGTPQPGYVKNEFGQFWSTSATDRLVSEYQRAVETDVDDDERRGARYSLASLLFSAGRHADAMRVCEAGLQAEPHNVPLLGIMARALAAQGNLSHAVQVAEAMSGLPHSASFRVELSELERLVPGDQNET
jgi:Flp pilus assembly protein TadD